MDALRGGPPSAALYLRSLKTNLGSAKEVTALSKDRTSVRARPTETGVQMITFRSRVQDLIPSLSLKLRESEGYAATLHPAAT